jgi:diacylglycerol kinase family enzyme
MAVTGGTIEGAEEAGYHPLLAPVPKRRMLVIVNPYATTVSDRLKNLVVYALRSRYEVEAVETEARAHATELCRSAARRGYDVVVAFGGDGTVNEAANGLAGSETPLTCLPGGATNVFCRTLGIPADVVDAAEHLLRLADDFHPRQVDLGTVNGRYFVFGSGVGLDASVVERVDRRPHLKARLGEWYFSYAAVTTFSRRYLVRPPRLRLNVDGRELDGVTLIVQNSDPFTYFGRRPLRVGTEAGLDTGSLSATVLARATPLELATIAPRVLSGRAETVARHRHVESLGAVDRVRVTAAGGGSLPLEVDGDFLGEFERVDYGVAPRALAVVA